MEHTTLKYFGKGFNFSQDGPGNRLVYHLVGCNFRCPWCSNPECFAGGTAVTVQTAEEITAEVLRSRPMFFSGGGVTFTGGEPTLQLDALERILGALRSEGVNTAMESNASSEHLLRLLPLIDHLMLDLKHTNDAAHRKITGVSVKTVLENIKAASNRQLALRIPLVTGYNTDDSAIDGFIDFITSLNPSEAFTVELLAYHEYGKIKWQQHGMEYTVENGFVDAGRLEEIRSRFIGAGINLINT